MPVRSREIHALSTRIQLPVMRKLLSIMDGQHSALRQGRGWEFMDLAPYQPGDDVREIDWAATARTGSPIIKRHEATANLQVMLVVDTGREMGALVPVWPGLANVLAACEVPSFAGENIPDGQPSHDAVTRALTMAVEAVNA